MVFNLAGYRLFFCYQAQQAQLQMIERLDNNIYNGVTLTEVKVALHLPYANNNEEFERCDGSIELNGVTYNYVERKISNDTLVLHCIPNTTIDKVKLAYTKYSRSINDLPSSQKGHHTHVLLKAFECIGYGMEDNYPCHHISFAIQRAGHSRVCDEIVHDKFAQSPEQPPDAA